MRKLTLSLIAGASALAVGGAAYAQVPPAQSSAAHASDANPADRAARQKALFERIDADHDGQVSFAEFTALHGQRDGRPHERGGRRGERFGQGGGEHRMAMHGGFGGRGGFAQLADANKDGAITRAEFEASAMQRFDRLDTDRDGTVTAAEAKAARDKMRQQWQSHRQNRAS